MPPSPTVTFRLSDDLLAGIEAARGSRGQSRTEFILDALHVAVHGAKSAQVLGAAAPRSVGSSEGNAVALQAAVARWKAARPGPVDPICRDAETAQREQEACPHPKGARRNLGYLTRCDACGARL